MREGTTDKELWDTATKSAYQYVCDWIMEQHNRTSCYDIIAHAVAEHLLEIDSTLVYEEPHA